MNAEKEAAEKARAESKAEMEAVEKQMVEKQMAEYIAAFGEKKRTAKQEQEARRKEDAAMIKARMKQAGRDAEAPEGARQNRQPEEEESAEIKEVYSGIGGDTPALNLDQIAPEISYASTASVADRGERKEGRSRR